MKLWRIKYVALFNSKFLYLKVPLSVFDPQRVNYRTAHWARPFTSTARQEAQFRLRPAANCCHQK